MKLTLRDFARAAKRRDHKAVAAHSSKRLRRLVWDRIPGAFWKVDLPAGGSSGSRKHSSRSGSVHVSVSVHGARARARVRWKGLDLNFSLVKEKGWKVDDLSVRWRSGKTVSHLDLSKDVSPVLAVYAFAMAVYQGNRDQMVRWAGPMLLAGGWQKLPTRLFERISARMRRPSKGPATGPSDKVASVLFIRDAGSRRRRLGLTMNSGRRLEATVVFGKHGWVVDDALLVEPRPEGSSVRRMRLSDLLAAAKALYDLVEKLSGSDLVDFRSLRAHVEKREAASRRVPNRSSMRIPAGAGHGRALGRWSKFLNSLSLVDFDDDGHRLWVAFSWKKAEGRVEFVFKQGRWRVFDARLDSNGRTIRLSDALGVRDLLVSLIKAALRAEIASIQKLSSPSLNQRVWARLGPLDRLKKCLLAGGLDALLGFSALPKNVFAKLGFGAKIALLARRIASGRLRLVGLWREGSTAFLVIRVGSVPITVQAVVSGGRWLLDDVSWKVAGRNLSLKKQAGNLLGNWSRSPARCAH